MVTDHSRAGVSGTGDTDPLGSDPGVGTAVLWVSVKDPAVVRALGVFVRLTWPQRQNCASVLHRDPGHQVVGRHPAALPARPAGPRPDARGWWR